MLNLRIRNCPPSRLGKLIEGQFLFGNHLKPIEKLILQMFESDSFNNLSIQLPIRHSKSTYAMIVALWLMCINPSERILFAAFSADAASEMLVKVRNALLAWGPAINHVVVDPKACRSDYFRIQGTNGECRAVSINSRFSHATATTIICDDIYTEDIANSSTMRKTIEDWFFGTLLNRRTKCERGQPKIICTMTPRHPEDILAKIKIRNEDAAPEDKWVIHRRPAINEWDETALFPELWPIEALLRKKKELEDAGKLHIWETLWMCNPQLSQFLSFNYEWLPVYGEKSKLPHINLWYDADIRPWIYQNTILKVVTADCSISGQGDYTAIPTVHVVRHPDKSLHLYVDKLFRKQCFVPVARAALAEIVLRDRPDAASCETNGFQRLIAYDANDEIAKRGFLAKIRPFEPPCGAWEKEDIALRLSDILAEGRLHLFNCPENRELRSELAAFPHGDHDDAADSIRQAVHLVNDILFQK